ncbi:hypothetical protein CTheo_6074 [Ceratobasidium theobromae]|uniref:Uncharacterized protein n=1 Tax=Ceratobasidium theobromae TaxID=1582974 RepID=A0A5N5QFG8_9AGAM|nr:hypothetical protein CTheo_6074 [Ceratobasidium theobromae]
MPLFNGLYKISTKPTNLFIKLSRNPDTLNVIEGIPLVAGPESSTVRIASSHGPADFLQTVVELYNVDGDRRRVDDPRDATKQIQASGSSNVNTDDNGLQNTGSRHRVVLDNWVRRHDWAVLGGARVDVCGAEALANSGRVS